MSERKTSKRLDSALKFILDMKPAPQSDSKPETVIPEDYRPLFNALSAKDPTSLLLAEHQCIVLMGELGRAEATITELNRKLEATLKDRNLCMESKAKLRTEFNSMKALREDASATGKESRNEF